MTTPRRVFAALKASKQIPLFIKLCYVILAKMKANAKYSSPPVAYADAEKHVNDLEQAEQSAHGGPKGAAQDRNFKLGLVRTDMRLLKEFVQSLAAAAGAEGASVIEGAGFTVSKTPERTKAPLAARYTGVPGQVRLDVKAQRRPVTYYWQMSVDQKTWTSLPDTEYAHTLVDGLTAGTLYYFRFRTLTKAGLSDGSPAITVPAH